MSKGCVLQQLPLTYAKVPIFIPLSDCNFF